MDFDDLQANPLHQQQFTTIKSKPQKNRKNHKKALSQNIQLLLKDIKDTFQQRQKLILDDIFRSKVVQLNGWINNSVKNNTALLVTLQVKKNQIDDLQNFILQVIQGLKTNPDKQFDEKYFQKFKYCLLKPTLIQVKDILLQMHIQQDYVDNMKQMLFIAPKVTDLSQKSLYLFKKSLNSKNFKLIIPTFSNMLINQAIDTDKCHQEAIEVMYMSLYDPKQLFVQLFNICFEDPKIKSYLPKQACDLISDFDYYPISYKQMSRRLLYLIQRNIIQNKKDNNFVDYFPILKPIYQIIIQKGTPSEQSICKQRIIKAILWSPNQQKMEEQNFKIKKDQKYLCQLEQKKKQNKNNEKYVFRILPRLIKQSQNSLSSSGDIQQNYIKQVKNKLINYYTTIQEKYAKKNRQGQFQFMECVKILNETQKQSKPTFKRQKKGDRSVMLGFNDENFKKTSMKSIFQQNLTKIIRKFTVDIRQQASKVKWQSYNFQRRIRPELPKQILANFIKSHKLNSMINKLIYNITSKYQIELKDLGNFNLKQLDEGEILYLITDLQIIGLIERTGKLSQFSYINNFYEKSEYRKKN